MELPRIRKIEKEQWLIEQIKNRDYRIFVLEQALRLIYKGPEAETVNFSKSTEMAKWICDTVDLAGDALNNNGHR